MNINSVDTFWVSIFIGGDEATAKQVCREYCTEVGLCVTVEPINYIYSYGEESGVKIGLINYPRFPDTEEGIFGKAESLSHLLLEMLCQRSFTIMTPDKTIWHSLDIPQQ